MFLLGGDGLEVVEITAFVASFLGIGSVIIVIRWFRNVVKNG
jgi:hypothetical protein